VANSATGAPFAFETAAMPASAADRNLDRLVDVFTENATVVLSGTKLASQLKVPPSTLWEWIERLRSMGVDIRGVQGTGYRLAKVPDILTSALVRRSLPHGQFCCRVHHFYKTDSTMNEAAQIAAQGEPHGTLIIAEEQTAGRGRLGNRWVSEPSVGLYFTIILRPALSPTAAPILTLMAGIAVDEALHDVSGLEFDLRWPNDVLIGGRKCAGILVEMTAEPEKIEHVLLGIGINVNQGHMPDELSAEATSLLMEAGRTFSRLEALVSILKRLEHHYNLLLEHGPQAVVQRFTELSSYAAGRPVKVIGAADTVRGVTAGLTPEGVLLLRRDDGNIEKILSGHVRPE
jgi:BirA family transcriptional regulator, biotin operon repressor / biotin---[acetyl-CoA-carboxylase] ligase